MTTAGETDPTAGGGGASDKKADFAAALDRAVAFAATDNLPGEAVMPASAKRSFQTDLATGVRWPPGYAMESGGLFYTPLGEDAAPVFLSGPFGIVGRCRDEAGARWGLVVRFADADGLEKIAVIAAADLAGDAGTVRQRLANLGLAITARKTARERLTEGLAAVHVEGRVLVVDRTGWTSNYQAFVLPDRTFGGTERTVIEGAPTNARIAEAGTLDEWRAWVATHTARHARLVFALCVAFASPLLGLVGAEACIFHTRGRSSSGKSTLLVLAASVWGSPAFVLSWRGTANSFDSIAALLSHLLLCLDELGIADARTIGDTVYTLTNGIAKSRMRSDGSMRPVTTWAVYCLSSGEVGLGDKLAEDGRRNLAGGQAVRFVELAIDPSSPAGVFDGCEAPERYAETAKAIKAAAATHFGTAGPAFLERLVADQPAAVAFVKTRIERFVQTNVPAGADGQVARVASKFALACAAGELAGRWDILPFEAGICEAAARRLFRSWLLDRGGTGAMEDAQAVARVREFLQAHANARMPLIGDAADRISSSFRAQMLCGYRDASWFYLTDSGFREALGGLDPAAAADALHRSGYLAKGDGGRRKVFVSTPDGRQRLYNITREILAHDDGT